MTREAPVYEAKRRLAKAIALETQLRLCCPEATPDQVRAAPPAWRQELARRAGVNLPSEETWRILVLLWAGEQLPKEYR